MNKDSIVAGIISSLMIGIGFLIFVSSLPFLYVWLGMSAKFPEERMDFQEKAVETSLFKYQKIYTRNSALPSLVLTKDFYTAIEYFEELEKLGAVDNANIKLAIFSYIRIGDYDKALKYAKQANDKVHQAQIYLLTKNYGKANEIVDELLTHKNIQLNTYIYKAELLVNVKKFALAEKYIDKALEKAPKNVDALYTKVKILNKTNRKEEAKKYFKKARVQEIKRSMLYN